MVNINNKNVINLIIQKDKRRKRRVNHHKVSNESPSESPSESTSSSSPNFSNSSNLETEILRENLHRIENPLINRTPIKTDRFREDDNFVREGNPIEETDVTSHFDEIYSENSENEINSLKTPTVLFRKGNKPGGYIDNRVKLKNYYKQIGGNNPMILGTTRKSTILNAIKELEKSNEEENRGRLNYLNFTG